MVSGAVRVYLEVGKTWTFACAVDWPGWCRRGKGEEDALERLGEYAPRYAVVGGRGITRSEFDVVGRIAGDATTDFGAPSRTGPWDGEPLRPAEANRLVKLLETTWRVFDDVVSGAPAELRKGPRGGGRDRDPMALHVREAEHAYARRAGIRVAPGASWPAARATVAAALRAGAPGGSWPARYAARRIAWHVMDHAWEIEDRSA